MSSSAWIVTALLLAQPGLSDSVQRSMAAENRLFLRCFEQQRLESGSVKLRFRVNEEARAAQAELEGLAPESAELAACLKLALESVRFQPDAVGADVVYPIRYSAATEDAPAPRPAPEKKQLSVERRDNFFLMDDWWVVDKKGIGVSDLDLTRIAGAATLGANLESRRTTFFTLTVVEAVVAVASLTVAGYGAYRAFDEPQSSQRPLHVGLAAGGGALSITAGGLGLYHLIRALDVGAATPVWHHLEQQEAEDLVGRANGESATPPG